MPPLGRHTGRNGERGEDVSDFEQVYRENADIVYRYLFSLSHDRDLSEDLTQQTFCEALRHAAFQVGSIITTTGFSSCDFDLWPTLSKEILVMLMFIGACAGSTGGGIKVSRFLILGKTLAKELKTALHPQVVAPARMDGKLLNHETIRTTNVFIAAYIFIFAASFFLISLNGFDMVTNFTAVAATLNNIGPGLEMAGPMQNFGCFADPAKLVLIFDMLAGRLEIFPMLVLFMPDTWRRF